MIKGVTVVLAAVWLGLLSGCDAPLVIGEYRFLQPDKPIAKPDQAQVNWIIQDMGELDKADEVYPNATKPGPQDWVYADEDYMIAPMDDLSISIMDLYAEGMETTLPRRVSDSGYIDLPQLDSRIFATGLTSMELTEAIKQAYSKDILRDPQVSVTVVVRRQQTFSLLGAIGRPGAYPFPRKDMRLLDALAMASGVTQPDIETIYISRQAPARRRSQADQATPATQPIQPATQEAPETQKTPVTSPAPSMMRLSETATGQVKPAPAPSPRTAPATQPAQAASYRWTYRNGEWVKVAVEAPAKTPASPTKTIPATGPTKPGKVGKPARAKIQPLPIKQGDPKDASDPFGWAKMEKGDLVRVIAIDLPKLRQGDYRQNVVIRANDIIHVPPLPVGEFYVMGEVLRPGVYSLTGRKVTIKMALAAAGNLGPMAWPSNSILIRRIGKNQEQTIPINIENIMRSKDPDLYLKKDDIIAVGTHWSSSFLAVLRNAFRMTYGFGFIYDRNFSDAMITPTSRRFKSW